MSMDRSRDKVGTGEQLVSWGQGIGLLILALAVRLWHLGGQSLWVDEVLQFNISRQPLSQMVQAIAGGAPCFRPTCPRCGWCNVYVH